MGLHFKTEKEQILDRYATIEPAILSAIETNRGAFMDLLGKIYDDTAGALINEVESESEKPPTAEEQATIIAAKRLVLAAYLVSFLVQDVPYLGDSLRQAHEKGIEDGYAYAQVKRMQRN